MLTPPGEVSAYERLSSSGRLVPSRRELRRVRPLRASPSLPSLSAALSDLRDDEA